MLRGIAVFAMQGRWQAAATAALLAIASMLLPPLNYLSGGVVALTTLRLGPREGLNIVLATLVVFALLAGLMMGQVWIAALLVLSSWLPVLLVTMTLGYSRSLAMAILTATGLGMTMVVLIHVLLGDPTAWWQQTLTPFMQILAEQPGWQFNSVQTEEVTSELSRLMTGLIAAGFSLNALLGLIIGRAWQAMLYNEGAFATEFKQLHLGKVAAVFAAVLLVVRIAAGEAMPAWLSDCLPVVVVAFAFQGLAVVHALAAFKQKSKGWLIALYILLAIMLPQMVVMLAVTGILDQWFDFRKRSVVE